MFTGIVEELGRVAQIERFPDAARLTVSGPLVTSDATIGDSIAVNGVCLTVTAKTADGFTADVMQETLARTTLGTLQIGAAVNLERPVTLATRLGGHLVQGHVDGIGTVVSRQPAEQWTTITVALPADLSRYVVAKGSIALDGTSLTVVAVQDDQVTVSLIPETLGRTTLGRCQPGDSINIEVDVLAKYVERLVARG